MAAAEIQVINPGNLQKIESFFNDSAYREAIENSANFNTRLCVERRLRMPFLDPQTGVAQTHCNLFMSRRQRMAGAREGQLYTYPAARWRKAKRQYLSLHRGAWPAGASEPDRGDTEPEDSAPAADHDGDSKDSHHKEDAKEWFYDEMTMEDLDQLEEPEPDSDEDYCDESYAARRRRGAAAAERAAAGAERVPGSASKGRRKAEPAEAPGSTPKGRGRGGGRGRKKAVQQTLPYEVAGDADKPYGLCGARYKTRPGLTYHYTHSHKEGGGGSDGDSRDSPARTPGAPAAAAGPPAAPGPIVPPDQPSTEYQDSYVTFITGNSGVAGRASPPPAPPAPPASPPAAPASPAQPPASHSPYCDFCLGDQSCNKKSGAPEELVSCSDCGRSGHPTCLQFTDNMIVSVRKYRWQCIECKCCSVCGTSDNDDQLLFCDDCDRGYHMYCLAPPLHSPPEGSWSCQLCLREFH